MDYIHHFKTFKLFLLHKIKIEFNIRRLNVSAIFTFDVFFSKSKRLSLCLGIKDNGDNCQIASRNGLLGTNRSLGDAHNMSSKILIKQLLNTVDHKSYHGKLKYFISLDHTICFNIVNFQMILQNRITAIKLTI